MRFNLGYEQLAGGHEGIFGLFLIYYFHESATELVQKVLFYIDGNPKYENQVTPYFAVFDELRMNPPL